MAFRGVADFQLLHFFSSMSTIQSAMDRRNNMSPHSPARRQMESSPVKNADTSEQNHKAMLRLTSPAVQTLNAVIQKIFVRCLAVQPVDPIAFVAESIRVAGLEHSATHSKKSKQSKFLPPVRPVISNKKKPPRRHQHR
jgi:hypothetical protein